MTHIALHVSSWSGCSENTAIQVPKAIWASIKDTAAHAELHFGQRFRSSDELLAVKVEEPAVEWASIYKLEPSPGNGKETSWCNSGQLADRAFNMLYMLQHVASMNEIEALRLKR